MARNFRTLRQKDGGRIEPDLVLTRVGDLNIRNVDVITRALLFGINNKAANILEGLIASPGAGLSVDLTRPAVVVQGISDSNVRVCLDNNNGNVFNETMAAADAVNPRIDVIEGRVTKRTEFTDPAVNVADPVTKVISPVTFDRDFEYFLELQVVTGTPAGSPTPPSTTAATAGTFTGSVTIGGTIDLTTNYIINLAVGSQDTEFVAVDCRGGTPAATTLAEILTALNGAGFGTIASDSGTAVKIDEILNTGELSQVRFKEPLAIANDGINTILGLTISPGYVFEFVGVNAFF